jgi:hypothetical protein
VTDREKSGPEKYAPPNWRAPKKLSDVDQAAANPVEDEIREFVRRDHQQRSKADAANDPTLEKLNELTRRVTGASAEEIDQVILELQRVRDMLHGEGERLSGEIAHYAGFKPAFNGRDEGYRRKPNTMERRLREPRAVDGGIQGAVAWR